MTHCFSKRADVIMKFGYGLGKLFFSFLLLEAAYCSFHPKTIEIRDGWIAETPEGAEVTGAFFKIKNYSEFDDEIISIQSSVSNDIQLHEVYINRDVMSMRRLPSLRLNKGEFHELEPGKMHLMIMGLSEPLKSGTNIDITFKFKVAKEKRVEFVVKKMEFQ